MVQIIHKVGVATGSDVANMTDSGGQPSGTDAPGVLLELGPTTGPGGQAQLDAGLGHVAGPTSGPARQQPFTRTLRNIGNTCFFNSVLQVLASVPQFVAEIAAQSPPPNTEDSSFCIAFLKLFVPAIAQVSSERGVVLDVTSVCDGEWRMEPDDWIDFVERLTIKHDTEYIVGAYADPSDLLEHLLSIVPAVERMFAIELRSTIRFPCACGRLPVRENTVRDLGLTVVVNGTDPLAHHIFNSLASEKVSYKCEACHFQSSEECTTST